MAFNGLLSPPLTHPHLKALQNSSLALLFCTLLSVSPQVGPSHWKEDDMIRPGIRGKPQCWVLPLLGPGKKKMRAKGEKGKMKSWST